MNIRDLVFSGNLNDLENALRANPSLASEELSLPDNPATAHPLHRICDGVFAGCYSEGTGLELARIFLRYGADLNVSRAPGEDSPLTTACSLHCDRLALFYIEQGARIDHRGCHGGTALHWSSWCGRDVIVEQLVRMSPDLNQRCIDFQSTPLFWAIHGYKFGGKENRHHQVRCAEILLQHGADHSIPNFEGYLPEQLLESGDHELRELFNKLP